MGEETTDTTNSYGLKPEGRYILTVTEVPEKRKTANASYRIWKFKYKDGDQMKKMSILLFPWESGELLLALDGVDEGQGKIRWNDEFVVGKTVVADLVHEKDYQDELREKLKNVVKPTDEVSNTQPVKGEQAEVAWDE